MVFGPAPASCGARGDVLAGLLGGAPVDFDGPPLKSAPSSIMICAVVQIPMIEPSS